MEDHAAAILEAMAPWTGGHRLPNFTFTPEEYVDAYDEVTIARLRRAIRGPTTPTASWRSAACWPDIGCC